MIRRQQPEEDYDESEIGSCTDGDSVDGKKHSLHHQLMGTLAPTTLPEDVFSFMLASLMLSVDREEKIRKHMGRFLTGLLLFAFVFFVQCYVLMHIYATVNPHLRMRAEETYDAFEIAMYKNTTLTVNGFARGVDGTYLPDNFGKMDLKTRLYVCSIALAHPTLLITMVLFWSATTAFRLRCMLRTIVRICAVPTQNQPHHEAFDIVDGHLHSRYLPCHLKLLMVGLVQIPRSLQAIMLLFVGTQNLIATQGINDILLNAVGLEFVLNLGELCYSAFLPRNMQLLVERVVLPDVSLGGKLAGACAFAAVAYSFLHVFVYEQVLPEFKWDLTAPCEMFLANYAAGRHSMKDGGRLTR